MLNISVIGIGNAGNQIAKEAQLAGIQSIALNSSDRDLKTVEDHVTTVILGDEKGAGKDRSIAKAFIKEGAADIVGILADVLDNKDIVLIAGSTSGGTGSGMAPVLQAFLSTMYPNIKFIIVGVVPTVSESLAAQENTLEYLQEMKRNNPTYLLYDNKAFEHLGPVSMLQTVNREIVEDFKVIRGDYQITTPYTSIDEKDAMKIYQSAGRLVIGRSFDFKEKDLTVESIEERIINQISNGAHVELEVDKIVKRAGLIVNLKEPLMETLDTNLPKVKSVFGEPVEGFEHIAVGDHPTRVAYVMSGVSFPDDRIEKTIKRIEEVQSKLSEQKSSILDGYDLTSAKQVREDKEEKAPVDIADAMSVFDQF